MSDWASFFAGLEDFGPQYTNIAYAALIGMLAFGVAVSLGMSHNDKKITAKYGATDPDAELEKMSRSIILLVFSSMLAIGFTNFSFLVMDWSKNKKWYLYKFWFPQMLA